MKFEDMGPGPLPETNEASNDKPALTDRSGDHGDVLEHRRPASPGVIHPDLIEAAIRMLADQGYRVFRSKDVKMIDASYAVRPSMLAMDSDEFSHIVNNRVLQDLSINVASSSAVRWERSDGHYGRLITAKVVVVMPEETSV